MHLCCLNHGIFVVEAMQIYGLNDTFVCLDHGFFAAETMHVYGRNDALLWPKSWHLHSRIYDTGNGRFGSVRFGF